MAIIFYANGVLTYRSLIINDYGWARIQFGKPIKFDRKACEILKLVSSFLVY